MKSLPKGKKINNIWNKFINGSVNRQIFGAALTVGIFTALVKGTAISKELVVAWKFGLSDEIDAYLIAFLVPSFIVSVIAGSFHSAFIPTYIKVREKEGKKAAQNLFSGMITWALALLAITTILIVSTAPLYLPLIAGGFDTKKLELTFKLLCVISPFILLNGIIVIWGAVLNAGERFALAAVTPILTPGFTMLLVIAFDSWRTYALAGGLLCGAIVEIMILGIALKKQGFSLFPKLYGLDSYSRQVIKQYAPTVAGSFLMCSHIVVDQSMVALLPAGSVSALSYGDRLVSLPLVLITTALNTAIVPYISKMVAHKDWKGVKRTLRNYLLLIYAATIPVTILIITFSEPIVRLLFQRGSFTAEDTQLVTDIQKYYALQIPFYISAIFVVKLIVSINKNFILMWGSGLSLIVNIVANYVFMNWIGIRGIALSTSCVYLTSFCFLFFFAKKYLNELASKKEIV
jgi:putative peptidoglycan lipid II flippase